MTDPDKRGGGHAGVGADIRQETGQGTSTARRGRDRARIDAVFGETPAESTSDDTRDSGDGFDDDWWRDQRPPHHG